MPLLCLTANPGAAATFSLCALSVLSPIAMVALPYLGPNPFELKSKQLVCGVDCYGMLVSLAFRMAVLAVGTWAVFFRPSRATLPRMRIFRAVVSALAAVFLVSFWLFYASHLAHERELVEYSGLVRFALSLTDSLLFVHYLAVLLIELRHRRAQYYIKVRATAIFQRIRFAMQFPVAVAHARVDVKNLLRLPSFLPSPIMR